MNTRFIIMHSLSLTADQRLNVLGEIKHHATLLDVSDDVYLFDGDDSKVREIIKPFIGEWSISPVKQVG